VTYQPTGFALDIFHKRHAAHENETWEEACDRVAQHVANAENGEARNQWRDRFATTLKNNLLMPGGRIWYGAGRARGNLLNCFVVPTSDSREGWGKTVSDTIIISGTGGGVGCNFSPTRPRGSLVNGVGGTATGAVSEMTMVNSVGEVIKMGGGRRIALMFCLSLSHGDIVEFLDEKLDKDKLNNANVSVVFDDDPNRFFELVKTDGEWPLLHQGKKVGAIPAKLLWTRIVENALKGGEPGLLNGYLANQMSNIWYHEQLTSTNPCFHPDTRISTSKGMMRIEDMARDSKGATVVSDNRVHKGNKLGYEHGTKLRPAVDVELKQHNAPVWKVTTEHGYTVTATAEHDFVTANGRRRLADLREGDVLLLPSGEGSFGDKHTFDEGLVLGLYVSDGTSTKEEAFVDIWADDFEDADRILASVNAVANDQPTYNSSRDYGSFAWIETDVVKKRAGGRRLRRWLTGLADNEQFETLKKRVPESVWCGSREFVRGYIQGLFYGDGSLNVAGHATKETVSLRLAQSNLELLEDVQRLLTQFAIISRTYLRRSAAMRSMPNGRGGMSDYYCQDQFELVINRPNLITFQTSVGLTGRKALAVTAALEARGTDCRRPERYITRVVDIEPAGTSDVYCLTQPETNCVISDGIVNGQCGEIWLSPYDCCCLGALVLPRFIVGGEVDWDMLRDTVKIGVRFLDDVLTTNQYPLAEIAAKCSQLRRVGLGIMGLHHMLLEVGLKYNAPEGLEFVDQLMKKIKNWAYEASSDLAAEKGSFPVFDADKFLKSKFAKNLKPSLREKIRTQGIRNCAVLTIAPTGTISMICDVSSGIEPVFAPAYERRYRDGEDLAMEVVVDPMFQRFVNEGRDVKHFVGAHDLSIRDHMEMQRVCQRHVDNAVSKTINCPPNTSVEELSELYMEFLPDLKGVTVYPDGSREDQPLTPLTIEQALNLALNSRVGVSGVDSCRNGTCDI
jgi:ribonucleoside-diphosphate reductase alpha chain